MADLRDRPAQEVLDDHLNIAQKWAGSEVDLERSFRRTCSATARRAPSYSRTGARSAVYEGVRELALMLGEELPEHQAFH